MLAGLSEKVIELSERFGGKRTGRFQEHLEDSGAITPNKRIGAPHCLHAIFSFMRFIQRLALSGPCPAKVRPDRSAARTNSAGVHEVIRTFSRQTIQPPLAREGIIVALAEEL